MEIDPSAVSRLGCKGVCTKNSYVTQRFLTFAVAFHEQTGHKVAIKVLNKRKIRQYGVFEKVKRELKILRRFNNLHTIKLFEFIDTQSEIFMVLEYAAGGELFDLIAKRERVSI
jgi:5'-AMP-activated protein kinase catalytic alpha subunit